MSELAHVFHLVVRAHMNMARGRRPGRLSRGARAAREKRRPAARAARPRSQAGPGAPTRETEVSRADTIDFHS